MSKYSIILLVITLIRNEVVLLEFKNSYIFLQRKKEEKEVKKGKAAVQYLPSADAVLGYVLPKYVSGSVYGAIAESFASEQAARRTAMESATDNANEMISKLELVYNRARQAAVTQEISEIVGGAAAAK